MAAEKGEIPNTLTFSIPMGGQSGTLMFFFKSVTYWPTLSKFRGGPVKKKPPCTTQLCAPRLVAQGGDGEQRAQVFQHGVAHHAALRA